MRAWMFYSWLEDCNDDWKLLENQALYIGQFSNPEAVKKILGQGAETFTSTDAEFEETAKMIREEGERGRQEKEKNNRKKKKRKIQG